MAELRLKNCTPFSWFPSTRFEKHSAVSQTMVVMEWDRGEAKANTIRNMDPEGGIKMNNTLSRRQFLHCH